MTAEAERRCGVFAVMGAPNAGKSTLVNALVGQKVSIVAPKAQTTRSRVLAVFVEGPAQIALIDTPGLFEPRRRLDRAMTQAAWAGAAEADMALLVVDASRPKGVAAGVAAAQALQAQDRPALLALNQIDRMKPPDLLAVAAKLNAVAPMRETAMVSATTGDGLDRLRSILRDLSTPGPWAFPEDWIGDQPARVFAAEITREKLLRQLRAELPYDLTVETETWTDFDDGSVKIEQVIYVLRDSQKGIVVGKRGAMVRSVREAAQAELSVELDRPVHLFLRVIAKERWMDDPDRYRALGLDFS
ncbi:MAG: GTPase Era [Pseudomonadota bacterium]